MPKKEKKKKHKKLFTRAKLDFPTEMRLLQKEADAGCFLDEARQHETNKYYRIWKMLDAMKKPLQKLIGEIAAPVDLSKEIVVQEPLFKSDLPQQRLLRKRRKVSLSEYA